MSDQTPQLLHSIEEVVEILRISRTSVYQLIKAGELHTIHIGRSCRISSDELARFVRDLDRPAHHASAPLATALPAPAPVAGRRGRPRQDGLFDVSADPQPAA